MDPRSLFRLYCTVEADFLVSAAAIAVAQPPVVWSGRSWTHFERKTDAHHFVVQAWAHFRAPSVLFCTGLIFLYSQLSRIGNLFSPTWPVKHHVGTCFSVFFYWQNVNIQHWKFWGKEKLFNNEYLNIFLNFCPESDIVPAGKSI